MDQNKLTHQIIVAVQQELKDPSIEIVATTSLQDLKGFNSLLVAGLLERLESQLGIEMDPVLILPETFTNPMTIAEAFIKSHSRIQEAIS